MGRRKVYDLPTARARDEGLTLFNATIAAGVPKMPEHNVLRRIRPEEIPSYDFCPADEEILEKLLRLA